MPGSEALAVQVGLGILRGCMSTFGSWREQRGRVSSPEPHRMNFLPERVACRQKGGGPSDRQNQQIWPIDALTFKACSVPTVAGGASASFQRSYREK